MTGVKKTRRPGGMVSLRCGVLVRAFFLKDHSVLTAPRAFAPPSSLYAAPSDAAPPPAVAQVPPIAIRKTETADEVYARRLAMSRGVDPAQAPSVGPQAGPSSVRPSVSPMGVEATSAARPPPVFQPSGGPAFQPPTFKPPSVQPPSFQPPSFQPPSFQPPSFQPATSPNPPIALTHNAPVPTLPTTTGQPDPDDFQKTLDARRLAAESIAKRLAAQFAQQVPGIGSYEGVVPEEKREEVDTSGMEAEDVVDLLARQVERDAGAGGEAVE